MFYVIEKEKQLDELYNIECSFIRVIPYNNKCHPALSKISLIYIRPFLDHKGYIICIDHNESLSISLDIVKSKVLSKIHNCFVIDKKEILHYNLLEHNIYDVNFLNLNLKIKDQLGNNCINHYYDLMGNLSNINYLIPISKHYEECEKLYSYLFDNVLSKLTKKDPSLYKIPTFEETLREPFSTNNGLITYAFYEIEKKGIKIDKNRYFEHFSNKISNHEFFIRRGKIYTHYNLYTKTGRPSNTFNNINFAALNKKTGERSIIIPKNNFLLEMDINGYHPRILAELIEYEYPKDINIYDHLSNILKQENIKELVFTQMYGGVEEEYSDKPFFKDIIKYVRSFPKPGFISSKIRNINNIYDNPYKTLSYIIQGMETFNNSVIIYKINDLLKYKKTKLILYTYDAFLFDFDKEEEELIDKIKTIIKYPVKIKYGFNYNEMNESLK